MKKLSTLVLALSLALTAGACKKKESSADIAVRLLDQYLEMSSGTDVNTVLAKRNTIRGGGWVVVTANGLAVALNMNGFDRSWNYVEYYTYLVSNPGIAYANVVETAPGSNIWTDGTYFYEATSASAKDLETAAALTEMTRIQFMAQDLAATYGLSDVRSNEMAQLLNRAAQAKVTRGLTEADLNALTLEAAGASLADLDAAQSDAVKAAELLNRAAEINGVSVETMARILGTL